MLKNTAALSFRKDAVFTLLALMAAATLVPLLFKQQFVTGSIVNAALFIGAARLGARDGLLIGLVPSTVALAAGLLSPVLAPMVPFIIVGNAILVLTFCLLKNVNYWAAVAAGSLLKFAFLYGTSHIVIGLLLNQQAAPAVANMLAWPQLVTAAAGGILAFGILKAFKRSPAV